MIKPVKNIKISSNSMERSVFLMLISSSFLLGVVAGMMVIIRLSGGVS